MVRDGQSMGHTGEMGGQAKAENSVTSCREDRSAKALGQIHTGTQLESSD